MALSSADLYASFDVTAGAFTQDISPALVEAVYFDLNFLEAVPLAWDAPVYDTVHYWNEDALNADTITTSASIASGGTTLVATSTAGRGIVAGTLLTAQTPPNGSREMIQVTAVDAGLQSLTVTRSFGGGAAVSYATSQVFYVIEAQQEGSDIGTDASVTPTVRSNSTQILGTRDLKVSGTQLARRMATRELQDWVGHQLANRAIELKRKLILVQLLGEPASSAVGSDTVYRAMRGLRAWAASFGTTNSVSGALSLASLNLVNKSIVDLGEYVDTLVIGTALVSSVAGIDSSNRRLYESDTAVGYTVQEILLDQGNSVRVVIDARVPAGEAYMFIKNKVIPKPMAGRGMFTIAATDFTDARKRRILGEWTQQLENPELLGYLCQKT